MIKNDFKEKLEEIFNDKITKMEALTTQVTLLLQQRLIRLFQNMFPVSTTLLVTAATISTAIKIILAPLTETAAVILV